MEENIKGNQPISIVDPEAHSMLDKNNKWGDLIIISNQALMTNMV